MQRITEPELRGWMERELERDASFIEAAHGHDPRTMKNYRAAYTQGALSVIVELRKRGVIAPYQKSD